MAQKTSWEQERDWASARVAIAKAAMDALDEALRSLKLQRKAAEAKYHQRLAENTQVLLAKPIARATAEAGAGRAGS